MVRTEKDWNETREYGARLGATAVFSAYYTILFLKCSI